MDKDLSSDPFTHHVLSKISDDILSSLTPEQLSEISDAISASRPLKKHPVDFRGVVSLFFARFYFVLLMGRDRRYSVKSVEKERRRTSDIIASIIFIFTILSPIVVGIFFLLYLTKSFLGFDIFPDSHLWDILR